MLQENHIVGKSFCRKNLSQKILLQENHIPGNTSSLASSFFVLFFAKRQKKFMSKRSPLRQRERSDRGAAEGERSRMPGKSEATEELQEKKITTAAEGAKRPGAAAGERSRMPGKSEATEQF